MRQGMIEEKYYIDLVQEDFFKKEIFNFKNDKKNFR